MQLLDMGEYAWVAYAPVEELEPDEFERIELSSLVGAVEKRRREFQSGRRLARRLLATNGHQPAVIPMGDNRLPVWPPNVIASISHTNALVAVALARSPRVKSLGIDIEHLDGARSDIEDLVLLRHEKTVTESSKACLTEFFSAKEAVFKACFPLHQEYFEFTDIEVDFQGADFRARSVSPLHSAETIENGVGQFAIIQDHVISLYVAV